MSALRAEHRCDDEPGGRAGRVVLLDRRLRRDRREQVERDLGERRSAAPGARQRQSGERQDEGEQVADPALVEGLAEHDARGR